MIGRWVMGNVIGALVGTINLGKPNFPDKTTQGRAGSRYAIAHKLVAA